LQWQRVENPLDGTYRTGTVRSSKEGGVFVADFYNSTDRMSRHLWSVLPTTSEAFEHHLMELERIAAERTDCSYVLDRAAATASGGVIVVVMHGEGHLTLTPIGTDGIPRASMDVPVFLGGLDCEHLSMVAGYGEVYILDSSTPQLVTVDIRAAYQGHSNAVSMVSLPFTPSSGALSLPPNLACEVDPLVLPATSTMEEHVAGAITSTPSAMAVFFTALVALWSA